MIQHDLMKVLVNALKINDQAILFKAATSCVTIAAGNHAQTKALVDAGAAEALVRLINIPDHDVAKQALWAVSNIVADAQEFRDAVIECHGIDAMVELSRHINNISTPFARTLSWAYSNMCFFNNHPFIPQEELRKLIKGIHLLVDYDDIEVEGDALKAIVWATEHSDDVRELVVQSELLEITHNKLSGQESSNLKWTINILVNIAKGNHHFRQVIIDSGFLREISTLVGKDDVDESVIKESIWLISKISYGSDDQIQAIFNAGLIPFVRKALDNEVDETVKDEAIRAIHHMTMSGTSEQIMTMVHEGFLTELCKVLNSSSGDTKMINYTLESISTALNITQTQ